jgi:peptide/nickel transport system substrate-binding protein
MGAGSLTKPEQFVVVDDHTVRVDFAKKGPLTIPDLAVIVPCVINSELVKKNASEKGPVGPGIHQAEHRRLRRLSRGAVDRGTEVILERNDKWVGGPLPKVKRIVWRMVPSAGNRPGAAGARRRRHLL